MCLNDEEWMINFVILKPILNKASMNFLYQLQDVYRKPDKDFWSLLMCLSLVLTKPYGNFM